MGCLISMMKFRSVILVLLSLFMELLLLLHIRDLRRVHSFRVWPKLVSLLTGRPCILSRWVWGLTIFCGNTMITDGLLRIQMVSIQEFRHSIIEITTELLPTFYKMRVI